MSAVVQLDSVEQNEEFVKKVKEVMPHVVGAESYGDEHEFYDEDGVVLIKVVSSPEDDVARVVFCTDDIEFEVVKREEIHS